MTRAHNLLLFFDLVQHHVKSNRGESCLLIPWHCCPEPSQRSVLIEGTFALALALALVPTGAVATMPVQSKERQV